MISLADVTLAWKINVHNSNTIKLTIMTIHQKNWQKYENTTYLKMYSIFIKNIVSMIKMLKC